MGGAQIVFLTISTVVTSFIPSTRIVMMVINCAASMVGMILIWKLDQGQPAGQMVGITLGAVFGVNIPLSLSLISSNVAGFTKRSVTSALLFIAYCVGNIVGPQFFLASEEPNYPVCCAGRMARNRLTEIDGNQGRHERVGTGHGLPPWAHGVLHLGESPPQPNPWAAGRHHGRRRVGAGPVEPDGPGDSQFSICAVMGILEPGYTIYE